MNEWELCLAVAKVAPNTGMVSAKSRTLLAVQEEITTLREQVAALTKERDELHRAFNQPVQKSEWGKMQDHLAAFAAQNEKMRKALEAQPRQTKMDWKGVHTPNETTQLRDEALSLPDLATPVLNRIRAEGMRMAAEICEQVQVILPGHHQFTGLNVQHDCVKAIRARAAELEKTNVDQQSR